MLLSAQSIVAGNLTGTVQRADGGAVSQPLMTLRSDDRGLTRQTVADASGRFSFGFVDPGSYTVRAEALGFRPVVAVSVHVGAGDATILTLEMQAAAPPVTAVDTVDVRSAGSAFWRRGGVRLGAMGIDAALDPHDDLSAVVALSSRDDADFGSEGLPGHYSLVTVDGVPFHPAMHPAMRTEGVASPLFPRVTFSDLDVLQAPPDIEWSGSAGGVLALTSRSAVGADGTALGGAWSGDPLWSSSKATFDAPALTSWWGSGGASLEIAPDTSRVFVAGEALQIDAPLAPRLGSEVAGQLTTLDGQTAQALTLPAIERTRRASGLARLDWALGTNRRLMLRAGVGRLQREFEGFGPAGAGYGTAPAETATDFSVAGSVVTEYERDLMLELRGGISGSTRVYDPAMPDVPESAFVDSGMTFGDRAAADVSRIDVDFSPIIHYPFGPGTAKAGATIRATQHKLTWDEWNGGRYVFSDAAAAAAGRGAVVRSNGFPESSFSTTGLGLFGQYAWEFARGLHVSVGGRFDYEVIPSSLLVPNANWFEATGIDNAEFPSNLVQVGGIGTLSWDALGDGRTILDATFSVIEGDLDPALMHEVFSRDVEATVTRYVGTFLGWPGTSVPSSARTATALTILGPDSRAPRSTRASLGLRQQLGGGWSLFVGAGARRTDFLPRRRDLNLTVFPLASDPNGRPILGDIQKMGALVAPDPGSNRRFLGFDEVWAVDTDGWSEYRRVSVGMDHHSSSVDFFAEYTRSETRDNWFGAAAGVPEAQLPPGLPEQDAWMEATSDFDVPDRLTAGLTVGLGPGRVVSATGVVRYESGMPFTPGYRRGVDINGDGSALNDVAWVPGAAELSGVLTDWPCLSDQADGFAGRNSCRGPARTRVDARLRARLARVGGRSVELVVDAYNLVETEEGLRDTALLLVDPNGAITTSGDGSTITVPVTVNPDFGKILVPTGWGRTIRVGFRIGGAP